MRRVFFSFFVGKGGEPNFDFFEGGTQKGGNNFLRGGNQSRMKLWIIFNRHGDEICSPGGDAMAIPFKVLRHKIKEMSKAMNIKRGLIFIVTVIAINL